MDKIINELIAKLRTGWEKNGFNDGLKDVVKPPVGGSMFSTDSYKKGWYEGEQVRKAKEGIE